MLIDFLDYFYNSLFKKNNIYKITYIFIMIFLFSIIYTFFDNDDFTGWIDMIDEKFISNVDNKKKKEIFNKYSTHNYMTKKEFMKIPILKIHNHFHILDSPNTLSYTNTNHYYKTLLYDVFADNDKLLLDKFLNIPFKNTLNNENYDTKLSFFKYRLTVDDYFDRLYYSIIIQSTIGFGDVFPANKSVRFVTMLQALCTIFIIFI